MGAAPSALGLCEPPAAPQMVPLGSPDAQACGRSRGSARAHTFDIHILLQLCKYARCPPPRPPVASGSIAVGTPPLPAAASTAKTLTKANAQRSQEMLRKPEIAPQLQVEGVHRPSRVDPHHLHTARTRGGEARGGYGKGGSQGRRGGGGWAGGGLDSSSRAQGVSRTPAEVGGPPSRVGRRGCAVYQRLVVARGPSS